MLSTVPTFRVVSAVLLSSLGCLLALAPALAQETTARITTGEYAGKWADVKVTFRIQEVHPNGHFDGIGKYLDDARGNLEFGIHGKFEEDGTLTLTRYTGGGSQVGKSGAPIRRDGQLVFAGPVKGIGVGDEGVYSFEIVLPAPKQPTKKTGPLTASYRALETGNYTKALTLLDKYLESKPKNPGQAHYLRGKALARLNRFDEAEEALTQSVKNAPKAAVAYLERSLVRMRKRKHKEAWEDVEKAAELAPKSPAVAIQRGVLLADTGKRAEGLAEFDRVIQANPKNAQAYLARGTFHMRENVGRMVRRMPDGKEVLFEMVNPASARKGLPDLNRARELSAANYEILDACVQCYQALEDHERSVSALKALVELAPHRGDLVNGLAWLLACSDKAALRDGKTAVRLALGLVKETKGKDPFVFDTLAAAYAETEEFDKAVATQKKVIAMLKLEGNNNPFAERLRLYQQNKPYRISSKGRRPPSTSKGTQGEGRRDDDKGQTHP